MTTAARIGLLTGGLGTYWSQFDGMLEGVLESSAYVTRRLGESGAEIVDVGVISNDSDGSEAAEKLAAESLDVLVVFVATYMTSGQIISIARECKVPVLLLELQPAAKMNHATAQTPDFLRYAGVAGLPELCNVFERCRVVHDVIIGHLKDESVWARTRTWLRAAAALPALRYARFGLMGHLYPGMLDIQTNLTSLIRSFGANVDIIEVDDLRRTMEAVTDHELGEMSARIERDFTVLPGISSQHLAIQTRVAAGLDKLFSERRLDGMAYFHFGNGGDVHEQIAGGMAIGGSFQITDGRPVATEFDLRAVFAMFILNSLGTESMFTELYSVNYDDGVVEVGHDGATNLTMTAPSAVIRPLAVFHGKSGSGNAVESTAAPGPITHLAVGELGDGSIRLVVGEGEVVAGPLMSIGNTVSRVDFSCPPGTWVEKWSKSGSGHHFGMGRGHLAAEVQVLAGLLGLECEVVRP